MIDGDDELMVIWSKETSYFIETIQRRGGQI